MNLKTRLRSTFMRYSSSLRYQQKLRAKAHKRRTKRGLPPVVHYFHQVDDPYSHLAIQKLDQLTKQYSLTFEPHLVSKPDHAFQGSKDHFAQWARQDVINVAQDFNTKFPTSADPSAALNAAQILQANQTLAHHLTQPNFAEQAIHIGTALWSNQPLDLETETETTQPTAGERAVQTGNALRAQLGHYQGAMFYFDGEWFWGVDRLRLLEERLTNEGYASTDSPLCVPEPKPRSTNGANATDVLLEYFPSLRSPYTAIGHQRVVDLVARSGVHLKIRPVMPMLMRGIPAPLAKQRYIITDAGREGRAQGSPLGKIVDPFGEPVKRAFALFPGAESLGKGLEFVTAYLQAAWVDGIDITTDAGLRLVVDNAGLDWQTLQQATQNTNWEAILEENLQDLLGENLWGVPSFRISGGTISGSVFSGSVFSGSTKGEPFACWGQDRIWRVENEIAARSQI
jgi:2-hydroxychromene-2-carboxylate isomerase